MRVLLTTPTYPPFNSGLGNAVARQAAQLARRDIDVVVATGGRRRGSRVHQGVRVEEFAVEGAEFLRNPIRGDIHAYVEFLRREPFDVIVMNAWQTWSTDLVLREAGTIAAPKVLYSHCISTNSWPPIGLIRATAFYLLWRPYWWTLASKMRRLSAIIFLAEGGDDDRFDDLEVARRVGIPTYIVPNSLDEQGLSQPSSPSRTLLISVGSYTPAKGFDFVLRAYAASTAKNRFPLAFFGQSQTPFVARLRSLVDQLQVDPSMISYNFDVSGEALLREYARAKLFLSGSCTECQPLVLLDAMRTGTPFVARATGCISRMPGGVAVRNEASAANEISRLLDNDATWAEQSDMGRRAANEVYASQRNADLLLGALEDVVGRT